MVNLIFKANFCVSGKGMGDGPDREKRPDAEQSEG